MARLNSMLCVVCILALPTMLGGCAGALIVGGIAAAGGGGYAAAQERGVGGAVGDLELQTDVQRAFVDAGPGLQEGIATTVYQGRVMLTGRVATPDMKARAVQVAGRVAGVRTLYDEVEVAPPGSTWDGAKDAWITARLRSEMMLDPDVRSGNYTIDTSNGSVYLIGSARTAAELELATRIARYARQRGGATARRRPDARVMTVVGQVSSGRAADRPPVFPYRVARGDGAERKLVASRHRLADLDLRVAHADDVTRGQRINGDRHIIARMDAHRAPHRNAGRGRGGRHGSTCAPIEQSIDPGGIR